MPVGLMIEAPGNSPGSFNVDRWPSEGHSPPPDFLNPIWLSPEVTVLSNRLKSEFLCRIVRA
jgi:hypothetical protein